MSWTRKIFLFLSITSCIQESTAINLTNGLYAAFDTSMGSFTCRLDYVEAPLTCANFAGLADGSKSWIDPQDGRVRNDPFYDGLIFHRVIKNFMIQGGDPLGTGTGGPGYSFPDQFGSLTHSKTGMLSMANSGEDTNGSQFFITLEPTTWLDGKHVVFGKVVDGLNVVLSIGNVATTNNAPLTNVVINHIQILRIGTEAKNIDFSTQPLPKVTPLKLSVIQNSTNLIVESNPSNRSELIVYASTNLVKWRNKQQEYWSVAPSKWSILTSQNLKSEFFRGVRVFYPQAIPELPSNLINHTVKFIQESSQVIFNLKSNRKGDCSILGTPDEITYWNWMLEGQRAELEVHTKGNYYLKFNIYNGDPTNTIWNGYSFHDGSWHYAGKWNYTDTPQNE